MKRHLKLYLTASVLAVVASPALAADADSGDIVVTARRVEERLQDVPISITVFDQKALTDRNVSDAQDLVNYTPSMSTNARFGNENATYALRGFSQEAGTAPAVGVYFADVVAPRGFGVGVPAGDGAGPGSFFDLQNVQVLKGPQGTLFGRNTTGGAVLLVPQKPTDKLEGYVEGSAGNYDMRRIQAVINVPLADTVRLRLGADHQKRDGYVINDSGIGPRDYFDTNYIALRGSLVVDVTPDLENYTIASFSRSKNNGFIQKVTDCYPGNPPGDYGNAASNAFAYQFYSQICDSNNKPLNDNGYYHTAATMDDPVSWLRQWQAINTTTWKASDSLTVKNIISYARLQNKVNTPLYGLNLSIDTGTPPPPLGFGVLPFYFVNVRTVPGGYIADQSTFTEELQFQGRALDNRLNWQAGVFYEDSNPKSLTGSQPPLGITCSGAQSDNLSCFDISALDQYGNPVTPSGAVTQNLGKTWFTSKALYAQASYTITDQLTLTAGARYTWDKMRAMGQLSRYTFPVTYMDLGYGPVPVPIATKSCTLPGTTLPDCELEKTKKSSAPTWVIDLEYKPTNNMMAYAKYSRGYRTGGIKLDSPPELNIFNKEKVDAYEVGLKTSFNGAVRGVFNIAGFYNDFGNQQVQYGFFQNPCPYTAVDGGGDPICLPAIPVAPTAGPVNVGKSRIWGIEADGQVTVLDGLTLNASYAYLNTKAKKITSPELPTDSPWVAQGTIQEGDPLPFSPKHKLSVGATYILPLDESLGELSVAVNYTYTSSQIASYGGKYLASYFGRDLGVLGSRNLVDLYVNWRNVASGPVDLGFFVTNLTNQKYQTAYSDYTPFYGFGLASLGQPRMLGVRAKVSFGN